MAVAFADALTEFIELSDKIVGKSDRIFAHTKINGQTCDENFENTEECDELKGNGTRVTERRMPIVR